MARARLALLLAAAAAAGALGEAGPRPGDGACEGGAPSGECSEEGTALLQHARRKPHKKDKKDQDEALMPAKITKELTELKHKKKKKLKLGSKNSLPLCHESVVAETCRKLNDGDDTKNYVSAEKLRDIMSANSSAIAFVWDFLGLSYLGENVSCMSLCAAVMGQVGKVANLPPASDTACYTVKNVTRCDVNVQPRELLRQLKGMEDVQPDDGPEVDDSGEDESSLTATGASADARPARLVQHSLVATSHGFRRERRSVAALGAGADAGAGAGRLARRRSEDRPWYIPYSLWQATVRLASFFGIYPSSGSVNVWSAADEATSEGTDEATKEVDEKIASANVLAKAWVSTVLMELGNMDTAPMRSEWFGGEGPQNASGVRQRLLRALNFVDQKLDSIRYVFPADGAVDSTCKNNAAAYVWKSHSDSTEYEETQGPLCYTWEDPMSQHCALDSEGNYFVYLCQSWFDASSSFQVSTLVHEAIHHTGPVDVTYLVDEMKVLPQAKQLDNAANYEHFAQRVAMSAWGCADNDPLVVSFSCTPQECTCRALAVYCKDPTFGPEIRSACPGSCGLCLPPATGTDGCQEAEGLQTISIGEKIWQGSCDSFRYQGHCTEPNVLRACPISCGICKRPGCQDDPDFNVSTVDGKLTCKDWSEYEECWDSVKESCPTACRAEGCAR